MNIEVIVAISGGVSAISVAVISILPSIFAKRLREANERIDSLFYYTMSGPMYENIRKLAEGRFADYEMSGGLKREGLLILLLTVASVNLGFNSAPPAVYDVTVFGADRDPSVPGAEHDDTAAIQMAVDRAIETGGIVFFPGGVYDIQKPDDEFGIIKVFAATRLVFLGEGPQSVVRLRAGSYTRDPHLFLVDNKSRFIQFRHLTLDGNRDNVTVGENAHGIEVWDGVDIVIDQVHFLNMSNDGVHLTASGPGDVTERIDISRCYFENLGRNGITLHTQADRVRLALNTFRGISDQSIDFEPASGPIDDVTIIGNHIEHATSALAVTIGSSERVTFMGNRIVGGSVMQVNGKRSRIIGNYIDGGIDTMGFRGKAGLQIRRASEEVIIANNYIKAEDTTGPQPGEAISLLTDSAAPKQVVIQGNVLIGFTGINMTGGSDVTVMGNIMRHIGADPGVGVNIDTIGFAPIDGVIVSGNSMDGFEFGVQAVAKGFNITGLTVFGNDINNALFDVRLRRNPDGDIVHPIIATPGEIELIGLPRYYLRDANTFVVEIDPNGTFTANVGAVAYCTDPIVCGADKTFWVKESGSGTSFGWVPK